MRFGAAGIEGVVLDEGRRSADRRITGEMEGEGRLVSPAGGTAHGSDSARRYHATAGVGEAYFGSWAGFLKRCGRNASLSLGAHADGRSNRSVVRGRA